MLSGIDTNFAARYLLDKTLSPAPSLLSMSAPQSSPHLPGSESSLTPHAEPHFSSSQPLLWHRWLLLIRLHQINTACNIAFFRYHPTFIAYLQSTPSLAQPAMAPMASTHPSAPDKLPSLTLPATSPSGSPQSSLLTNSPLSNSTSGLTQHGLTPMASFQPSSPDYMPSLTLPAIPPTTIQPSLPTNSSSLQSLTQPGNSTYVFLSTIIVKLNTKLGTAWNVFFCNPSISNSSTPSLRQPAISPSAHQALPQSPLTPTASSHPSPSNVAPKASKQPSLPNTTLSSTQSAVAPSPTAHLSSSYTTSGLKQPSMEAPGTSQPSLHRASSPAVSGMNPTQPTNATTTLPLLPTKFSFPFLSPPSTKTRP
ncbi:hypothetical protein REPUB_Repub15cG0112600 [Reevesia pubescens]